MGTAFTDPKASDLTTVELGTTELATTDMVGSSTDLMRVGLRTPPVPIIEWLRLGESFAVACLRVCSGSVRSTSCVRCQF
jgi:hypothetical protein